jgi:hypothetical protein
MVSAIIFLTLTPNMPIPFTVILTHPSSSVIPHHQPHPLHFTLHTHFQWDALPCHYVPHWLTTIFIFLGLQTYLNSYKDSQFPSPMVLRISIHVFWIYV